MNTRYKLFHTSQSKTLGQSIAKLLGIECGKLYQEQFQDGEVYVRFDESVRGNTVFILGQVNMPYANLFELYLAVDAARRASAKEVICVVPYLPHSRQERREKDRSSIAIRVIADFFQNVGADRVITVDLHTSSIEGLFKIPIDHLDASEIFLEHLSHENIPDLLICSPDFGGVKRVKNYQSKFDSDVAIINKERLKANEIAKMEIIGNMEGKNVLIIDDIIDTAGTLCKASDLLIEKGAKSVSAYCTHGLFSGKAFERIESSVLKSVYVTDSIGVKNSIGKVKILSIDELIAKSIDTLINSKNQDT